MKPDFGKCVIERPRVGSSRPSEKARRYGKFVIDKEDGSLDYEGMTKLPCSRGDRVRSSDKEFTDLLGPLRGYLRSSCGRRWDDVFSELSTLLGRAGHALRHILTQHLDVAANTYISKSGHICNMDKHGPEFVSPGEFYVDPKTGILKQFAEVKGGRWRPRREYPSQPSPYELDVFLEDNDWYVKSQDTGVWFLATLAEKRDIGPEIVRSRRLYRVGAEPPAPLPIPSNYLQYREKAKYKHYGDTIHCFIRRKSLNKKEIKAMLQRRDAKLKQRYPNFK